MGKRKKRSHQLHSLSTIWGEGVSGNCFHTALRRIESRHHFLDRFEAITLAPSNEAFFYYVSYLYGSGKAQMEISELYLNCCYRTLE